MPTLKDLTMLFLLINNDPTDKDWLDEDFQYQTLLAFMLLEDESDKTLINHLAERAWREHPSTLAFCGLLGLGIVERVEPNPAHRFIHSRPLLRILAESCLRNQERATDGLLKIGQLMDACPVEVFDIFCCNIHNAFDAACDDKDHMAFKAINKIVPRPSLTAH